MKIKTDTYIEFEGGENTYYIRRVNCESEHLDGEDCMELREKDCWGDESVLFSLPVKDVHELINKLQVMFPVTEVDTTAPKKRGRPSKAS
jgi:hypothetical protein